MMKRVRSFFSWITLLAVIPIAATGQAAMEPLGAKDIHQHIEAFLETERPGLLAAYGSQVRLEYEIAALDNRLALAGCAQPPEVSRRDRGSNGRLNLRVSCAGPAPWSIFVPVDLALHRAVVVPTRPVARGELVTTEDLTLREMDVARLAGEYYTEIAQVAGQEARRPLSPDTPVLATSLDAPLLIRRGETVNVSAESAGIAVHTTAEALSDGRKGQRIRVRNNASQRVIDAWVNAPGEVTVNSRKSTQSHALKGSM